MKSPMAWGDLEMILLVIHCSIWVTVNPEMLECQIRSGLCSQGHHMLAMEPC